jgi:hypothetical protein
MPSDELPSEERLRELEVEVRVLRRTLTQRDEALVTLNRRLMELERGTNSGTETDTDRADEVARLEAELDRIRGTKLFRWSAPARDVYRQLRSDRAR